MSSLKQQLFAVFAILGMTFAVVDGAQAQEKRDGVLIHVTHGTEDPHRVLMALNMASLMSEDHPVLVYFDIKAIEVVLKDARNITYAQFPSSREQLSSFVKKGVTLMACPGCLQAAGKTQADLAEGVGTADKKRFFAFTTGRIVTLDY